MVAVLNLQKFSSRGHPYPNCADLLILFKIILLNPYSESKGSVARPYSRPMTGQLHTTRHAGMVVYGWGRVSGRVGRFGPQVSWRLAYEALHPPTEGPFRSFPNRLWIWRLSAETTLDHYKLIGCILLLQSRSPAVCRTEVILVRSWSCDRHWDKYLLILDLFK